MKTNYSYDHVTSFLSTQDALPHTLKQLKEGQLSQAFSFETPDGDERVLRISNQRGDLAADAYAYETFGKELLIPRIITMDQYADDSVYCISEKAPGVTTDILTDEEFASSLPSIETALSKVWLYDISQTIGYGPVDVTTGNGKHASWREMFEKSIEGYGLEKFREHADNIGVGSDIADQLLSQYRAALPYAPDKRWLLHGDPAFDNMLVRNNEVTGMIDWAQIGYGDWVADYARLEFWRLGRHTPAKKFAEKFNLDHDHLDERVALQWAFEGLRTIAYADFAKKEVIAAWLRANIASKIVEV